MGEEARVEKAKQNMATGWITVKQFLMIFA